LDTTPKKILSVGQTPKIPQLDTTQKTILPLGQTPKNGQAPEKILSTGQNSKEDTSNWTQLKKIYSQLDKLQRYPNCIKLHRRYSQMDKLQRPFSHGSNEIIHSKLHENEICSLVRKLKDLYILNLQCLLAWGNTLYDTSY
jgi:hypothetical protein